jgi:MFS family permease
MGAICIATIPLLADYVKNITKGKASGYNVIMSSIGAILSTQLIGGILKKKMDIKY